MIEEFRGEFAFLSNFYPTKGIEYDNEIYPTVEHAYQAAKFVNKKLRKDIQNASTPAEAKKLARIYKAFIIKNWDDIKVDIMLRLLMQKFSDPKLAKRLLNTDYQEIREGNWWNDTFWGVNIRTGKGENILGELLKVIREELRKK